MSAAPSPEWLRATVSAVRERMVKRLETDALDPLARREMELALEELDVLWEDLAGQAAMLARDNERLAEFFEYAPDGYLITDALGSVLEANQAALELLERARDAVVGRPVGEFVGRPQPAEGAPLEAEVSVRAIALKKRGERGLCWLIRPARARRT